MKAKAVFFASKRYLLLYCGLFLIALACTALLPSQTALAKNHSQEDPTIRGGALYDNWFATLGVTPPEGDMPLWSRQSNDTQSGVNTWRCVSCHGWDYQGNQGAYRAGSHFTGFPGVYQAGEQMDQEEIVAHLNGSRDPAHDFSAYLEERDLDALSTFLTGALIDDNEYINLQTMKVIDGDIEHGKSLYDQSCASCHGAQGEEKVFRFEGSAVDLGGLADVDPWRFLHKTRFGTPGTDMPIGYELGWTPQDGRDVLAYAQSIESSLQPEPLEPSLSGEDIGEPQEPVGGPASNFLTGLSTAFLVMATSLGFAILLGGIFVGTILLLVWLIRGRR